MVQQMDAFLRDLIGYQQNQITNLDIEWETHNEGLGTGYAAPTVVGSLVLVYRSPDGTLRSKPLTEEALHRYRDALLADIQQLGSSASMDPSPRQSLRGRPAQARPGRRGAKAIRDEQAPD